MSVTLVTGCAGFIGMHCAQALLARGEQVVGIDNLNAYYEVSLKEARLARLLQHPGFTFERTDVADRQAMRALFERVRPTRVLHLAAQAGVRYSIDQPDDYTDSNLLGFGNILQGCRAQQVAHLVFASSSSVYGGNARLPYSERDAVDHPISYYAATKKANEVMAHSYAHLYGLPTTGLRFFTVYGPWGRPDMALFKFTRAMLANEPIDVYGQGQLGAQADRLRRPSQGQGTARQVRGPGAAVVRHDWEQEELRRGRGIPLREFHPGAQGRG